MEFWLEMVLKNVGNSEKGGGNLAGRTFWAAEQTKQGYHGGVSTVYINKGFS